MRFSVSFVSAGVLGLVICLLTGDARSSPPQEKSRFQAVPPAVSHRAEWEQTENGVVLQSVLEEDAPVYIKQFVISNKNITK